MQYRSATKYAGQHATLGRVVLLCTEGSREYGATLQPATVTGFDSRADPLLTRAGASQEERAPRFAENVVMDEQGKLTADITAPFWCWPPRT